MNGVAQRFEPTPVGCFLWFVDVIRAGQRAGSVQFDIRSDLADVWRWAIDTSGFGKEDLDVFYAVLTNASIGQQAEVLEFVESESLFAGAAVWVKLQLAQVADFPLLRSWESLNGLRSLEDFRDVGIFAAVVSKTPPHRGKALLLAVLPVHTGMRNGLPQIHTLGFSMQGNALQGMETAASSARDFLGLRGLPLLLEYVLCGHILFVSLYRAVRMILSAFRLRCLMSESDHYLLADDPGRGEDEPFELRYLRENPLSSGVQGQSLVDAVRIAMLMAYFRLDNFKLWTGVFPNVLGAGFSGHADNYDEAPLGAVEQKIKAFQRAGVRRIFLAKPPEPMEVQTHGLEIHLCKSSYGLLRKLMGPWKIKLAWFTVNCCLVALPFVLVHLYWPKPEIESVIAEDVIEDANRIFHQGAAIRVRSGGLISLHVKAGRAAPMTEILVRSSRLQKDGTRVRVLLPGSRQDDLRAMPEVKLRLRDEMATFVYRSPNPPIQNDVLEIGFYRYGDLVGWYPLNLDVVRVEAPK